MYEVSKLLSNLTALEQFIGIYFLTYMAWNYTLLFSAWRQLKTNATPSLTKQWPSLTVLIPAYNEERCIVDSVNHLLKLPYPGELTVSICNDGSTDKTAELLDKHFSNNPRVSIVTQKNGGRAAALNAALNSAKGTYVCATDADTIIDGTSLQKIISELELDSKLEAVGGSILLSNDISSIESGQVIGQVPSRFLAGTQAVEYIRAFLYGRLGLNKLGGNVIISGAFGVFRRQTILDIGGWDADTVAEDFDMTVRIRQRGGKVKFIADPTAWTEVPEDLKTLGNQRERWHRGLSQILWRKGRSIIGRPRTRGLGLVVLPNYLIFEWLAPLVELLGYVIIALHYYNGSLVSTMLPIILLSYALCVVLSLISIRFEHKNFNRYVGKHDGKKLVLFSLLEPFWYRPLTVYWRLKGLVKFLFGSKTWGTMTRRGFRKITTALLFMSAATYAEAQTASTYARTETNGVPTRTDIFANVAFDNGLAVELQSASRLGNTDVSGAVSLNRRFGRFIAGGRVQVSPDAVLLPENSYGLTAGVILPAGFVVSGTVSELNFNTISTTNYNGMLEWYYKKSLFTFQSGTTSIDSTWYVRGSYRFMGESFDVTTYGSVGNELLDIPRFVARVYEVGILGRKKIGAVWIMGGIGYGERNTQTYIAPTAGISVRF